MLSLVCPVYNEAGNIGHLLDSVAAQVRVPFELTIVYDFDEDDTLPIVRERMQASPFPIRLLKNRYGRGALNAVKTGLEGGAGCTAVAVTMADLSDDLNDINTMYELIEENRYDVVCGSRYMRGGRQIGGPPLKSLMSRTAGLSLHLLSGIPTHDATNNFKMYRGAFIGATLIQSRAGFEIGLELVVKAYVAGYRIGEIPTTWRDRVSGTSHFNIRKWLPHYMRWYTYAFRRRTSSANI